MPRCCRAAESVVEIRAAGVGPRPTRRTYHRPPGNYRGRALSRKDCLSAHETGHGKSTSMSLQSGVGGRECRNRALGFPWAFTLDKTRTRDKTANLKLPRKFPKSFALHVVLEELLWLRIEFARCLSAAKETKANYGCVEIPTVKHKQIGNPICCFKVIIH